MKAELIYVEMTTDTSHTGPAWIGYGFFNRTRKTVYFNGRILGRGRSVVGNYVDIQSGEEFWISGIKKNGENRHWAGFGKIIIDNSAIDDYLKIIDESKLSKNKFLVTEFDNVPKIEIATKIENSKLK
jgi:hypothetical protein